MSTEELAPSFVVRAAAWPLSAVSDFGDAELAARAAATGAGDAGFADAYAAAIAEQRGRLWCRTAGDARFLRALSITNPELGRRVSERSPAATRNKRARHLDTTLYLYLARAAWRTEPCDLWSGVALGHFGAETSLSSVPRRYAFSPDLRPFQGLLAELARSARYARRGLFQLNPSLRRSGAGEFHFAARRSDGTLVERRVRGDAGLARLIALLEQCPPAPFLELVETLAQQAELERDSVAAALERCARGGLLLGGLVFPSQFSSAWQALTLVTRTLLGPDARAWRRAYRQLRRTCRSLERGLELLTPAELQARLDHAAGSVLELADRLGLERPSLPRALLRCDHAPPWRVTLGAEARAALSRALDEYVRLDAVSGLDAAARAAHRALVLAARSVPEPLPAPSSAECPTLEAAWRQYGAEPALGRRIATWAEWIGRGQSEVRCVADAEPTPGALDPPLGVFVVRSLPELPVIVGSSAELAAAYGRFLPLWHGLGRRARCPLHAWHLGELRRLEAFVDLLELVVPCESLPNALARPDFGLRRYEPWGAVADTPRLESASIAFPRGAGSPLLVWPGRPRPSALLFLAPAHVGHADPQIERLLLTSHRETPGWLPMHAPFACELERPRLSPALRLESGGTVRKRRSVIAGEALADLVRADAPQRFVLWQSLARAQGWPELLLVSKAGESAILLHRDSPLALEAVLEGIGNGVRYLAVEEAAEQAWLIDDQGEGHVAELILPYVRRMHGWIEPGARLAAAQSRPDAARA